jgi:hypothetical protein
MIKINTYDYHGDINILHKQLDVISVTEFECSDNEGDSLTELRKMIISYLICDM